MPVTHDLLAYIASGLVLLVGAAGIVVVARLRRTAHVAAHASR
ncbi:hypothetical protein [Dactylosporangium sp. CA-233914]